MIDLVPSRSVSLGFWVRHQEAMDAFVYEEVEGDKTPSELRKIFDDAHFRDLLDRINDASGHDGDAVIHALANRVASTWAEQEGLVIDRRKRADDWIERMYVRRKWSRGGASIEVGFKIVPTVHMGLRLYCYLWQSGAKAVADELARCIRDENPEAFVRIGRDDDGAVWDRGVVLVAAIPLARFMVDDELDCEGLLEEATSTILKCRAPALAKRMTKPDSVKGGRK